MGQFAPAKLNKAIFRHFKGLEVWFLMDLIFVLMEISQK